MKRITLPRIFALSISLIFVILFSSCTTQENVKVKAWIDTPQDGATYEVNTPVNIMSHAYAKDGVGEIMLSINGEAYRRDAAPPSDDNLISMTQEWVPKEPGEYVVQVKVIDVNGEVSLPAIVGVEVAEKKMASATPVITATEVVETTVTPVITFTPSFTPTRYISITPTISPTRYISVTPIPVDNQGPPAPIPAVPANGLELGCRSTQTLAWQPVSDPSGIDGYYVKVELVSGTGDWQSAGGYGPISGKQVDISVDCGIKYRWMVRAQDGAGNFSDWSSKSEFIIILE
ncbi:MAG: hypothetical protein JEZ00_13525 [Anaerolineaceae bacterium]|nr:hypothetical protein [Anaerolineaceae bacterium]